MFVLMKSKYRSELGIFIEVFRTIKRAKTLLLVSCKAASVKEQFMTNTENKMSNKQENELEGISLQNLRQILSHTNLELG